MTLLTRIMIFLSYHIHGYNKTSNYVEFRIRTSVTEAQLIFWEYARDVLHDLYLPTD